MVYISPELCYLIMQFSGDSSACFLNKEVYSYINEEREKFKKEPLILKYRLAKYRTNAYEDENYLSTSFPRMKVEDYKTIKLNGIIPLGNIIKNEIIPSQPLLDNIIPKKDTLLSWGAFPSLAPYRLTIYWELYDILPTSLERCKIYKLIFN